MGSKKKKVTGSELVKRAENANRNGTVAHVTPRANPYASLGAQIAGVKETALPAYTPTQTPIESTRKVLYDAALERLKSTNASRETLLQNERDIINGAGYPQAAKDAARKEYDRLMGGAAGTSPKNGFSFTGTPAPVKSGRERLYEASLQKAMADGSRPMYAFAPTPSNESIMTDALNMLLKKTTPGNIEQAKQAGRLEQAKQLEGLNERLNTPGTRVEFAQLDEYDSERERIHRQIGQVQDEIDSRFEKDMYDPKIDELSQQVDELVKQAEAAANASAAFQQRNGQSLNTAAYWQKQMAQAKQDADYGAGLDMGKRKTGDDVLLMQRHKAMQAAGIDPYGAYSTPEQRQSFSDLWKYKHMTGDEADYYAYLIGTGQEDKAKDFIRDMKATLNEREMTANLQGVSEMADKYPITSSILSVLESPLGAGAYLKSAIGRIAGEDVDINDPAYYPIRSRAAVQQTVSDKIDSGFWKWMYQNGMSIGENGMRMLTFGPFGKVGEAVSLMLMGSQSAANATVEAKQRGMSDEQALALGFINGAAEILTEKVSLENVLKLSGPAAQRSVLNVLKQMGIEASEETASWLIDELGDRRIGGDKSNYALNVQAYMKSGYSEQEARKLADRDAWLDVLNSAAGGAFSGGVMGGGATLVNYGRATSTGKGILQDGEASAYIDEGMGYDQGSDVQKLAADLQSGKKKLNAANLGSLAAGMQQMAQEGTAPAGANVDEQRQEAMRNQNMTAEERLQQAALEMAQQDAQSETEPAQSEAETAHPAENPVRPTQAQTAQQTPTMAMPKVTVKVSGKDTAVTGVEKLDGGVLTLKTESGTVTLSGDTDSPILQGASILPTTNAAKSMVMGYQGETDPGVYAVGFTDIFEAAANGTPYSQAVTGTQQASGLSFGEQQIAYMAGQNYRMNGTDAGAKAVAKQEQKQTGRAAMRKRAGGLTGLVKEYGQAAFDKLTLEQKRKATASFRIVNALAKKYGILVRVVPSIQYEDKGSGKVYSDNAYYDPKTNSIVMGLDADQSAYMPVFTHELTHYIKANNESEWGVFADFMRECLEKNGQDWDALVKRQMDKYGYSQEIAEEEVVANAVPAMLGEESNMRQLMQTDRSLCERIADFIKKFLSDIKEALQGLQNQPNSDWAQLKALENDHAALQEIYDRMMAMLDGKGEKGNDTQGVRNAVKQDVHGRKYVEIDRDILAGKPRGEWPSIVKKNLADRFPNGVIIGHNQIVINQKSRNELTGSRDSQWLHDNQRTMYADKMRITDNADEILLASRNYRNESINHQRKDNITQFARGDVLFKAGANEYEASVIVGYTKGGTLLLYDIIDMAPTAIVKQSKKNGNGYQLLADRRATPNNSIPNSGEKSNRSDEFSDGVRHAKKGDVAEKAKEIFGKTYNWAETGYVLEDGTRLDFSGKKDGARGGSRTLDHREVIEAYGDDTEMSGTEAMLRFMSLGSIRVMPECNGINLVTEPTRAQKEALDGFISNRRGEVTIDYDDGDGNTVYSKYYHRGTYSKTIIDDINDYFRNGVPAKKSEVARFHEDDADIRHSRKASDGTPLSEQQVKRFDYSKPFAEQVDDWIAGKIPQNDTLVLGGTPELYQKIGLSKLPMVIDQTHVDYAVNGTKNEDHHMGAAMLKQLPELLADPVAIIGSETRGNDSVVAIVTGTVNGHQMMAAVEIGGVGFTNGEALDVNVISSTQGRKNTITGLLANAIKKENAGNVGVYYIKKSEARSLFANAGVQFPGGTMQDGLNHSILDAGSPVNRKYLEQTETRQFKRWFGSSKVVNEDGTPKVMYHGTLANDLTEFRKDYIGSRYAADDVGFFFTDHQELANYYATSDFDSSKRGTVIPAFLSIQKPLVFDAKYAKANGYGGVFKTNDVVDVWDNYQAAILEDAERQGADGILLSDGKSTMGIAFDPTQIKSATDNIGTFDSKDADIRHSRKASDGTPLSEQQVKRFDYSKPFAEQVDDWIAGKIPQNDTLVLGGTPELYQKIGLSKLPMVIDQTHVDYAVNGTKNEDHHMGAAMLKQLPELLADPVAIIGSETRPNDSIVAIVNGTVNGHQMMAAVEIGGTGRQNDFAIDVNMVSSTQGRKNAITKLLTNAIEKENSEGFGVYYIKKVEARSLYARPGVQFPDPALQDGLIHSIFDAGSPVNKKFKEQTETSQFIRWFGKSKVVNEDGTPKVMYHGSEWNPLSEAPGKAVFRDESYFSANRDYAKKYAKENGTITEVYLSIQHPFDIRNDVDKKIYNEYRQGHEAAETPSSAIDWAEFEYDDLKEYLEENYPGKYDGFVCDEGGTTMPDGTNERGVSYVPFEATQIKSATDNNGMFDSKDADIRHSRKASDGTPLYDIIDMAPTAIVKQSKKSGNGYQLLADRIATPSTSISNSGQKSNSSEKNNDGVRRSPKGDGLTHEEQVAQAMTMTQARDMIQRVFALAGIREFGDGAYKNGDEWLRGDGVDDIAMYIDNESAVYEKYLSRIPGIVDGDITTDEIVQAYLDGKLTGAVQEKAKPERIDLSAKGPEDSRFYAPRVIKDAQSQYAVANQRVTNANKAQVTQARADILMFAHNKGAAEKLGITQTELNKKLRAWGGYSAKALEISTKINTGAAMANRWTGIENCSWMNRATVTEEALARMVKAIDGESSEYQRGYITRAMLALDTHIDWTGIRFTFNKGYANPGKTSVLGFYDYSDKHIVIGGNAYDNTVAHEMGHALDYMWGKELLGMSDTLSRHLYADRASRGLNEKQKQWYKNFCLFVDGLTDNGDLRSAYTQDAAEVFARFVAKFAAWADYEATGRHGVDGSCYDDKFTASQYIEFARLLQEKSATDNSGMTGPEDADIRHSRKASDGTPLTEQQVKRFENSKARDEEGNLLTVYHGSAGGYFTKFENAYGYGYFFTDDPDVAKTYTEVDDDVEPFAPARFKTWEDAVAAYLDIGVELEASKGGYAAASSDYGELSFGVDELRKAQDKLLEIKTERDSVFTRHSGYHTNTPVMHKGYLNITNPLTIEADGQHWDNVKSVVDGQEMGMATDEWAEWAHDHGYDGVIFHDLVDGGFGDVKPANVFVVFKSEQYKSAGNTDPTSDPDIRYSHKAERYANIEELLVENEKLRIANEALAKETKLTKGHHVSDAAVRGLAESLKRQTGSNISTDSILPDMKQLFEDIGNDDSMTWTDMRSAGVDICGRILDGVNAVDEEHAAQYAEVKKYLRGQSVALSDKQKAEAKKLCDSYGAYRRALFGTANVSDKGTPLDSLWGEMSEQFPWLFEEGLSEGDQVQALMNAADEMKPRLVNPYGYDREQYAVDLFMTMWDRFLATPEVKTYADRQRAKMNEQRVNYREKIRQVRDEARAKYDEKVRTLRMAQAEERKALSAEYNAAKRAGNDALRGRLLVQYTQLLNKQKQQSAAREAKGRYLKPMEKALKELRDWTMNPTDKKHVPEYLRVAIGDFLQAVDVTGSSQSRSAKSWRESLLSLQNALNNQHNGDANNDMAYYFEVDPDLPARVGEMAERAGKLGSAKALDAAGMKELYQIVKQVKRMVTTANRLFQNQQYAHVVELGDAAIYQMRGKNSKRSWGPFRMADRLLNDAQLDSFTYFERMGPAGQSIGKELRLGLDRKIASVEEARQMMHEALKGAPVREWTGSKAQAQSFTVSGGTLELTKAQVMSLYCLMKREQAVGHILGGGVKVERTQTAKMGQTESSASVTLTESDVQSILDTMTDDMRRVADAMQAFMSNEVSGWGNEVSMELYDTKKFTEKNYFPIVVDDNTTNAQDPQKNEGLYALRNLGMTKATVKGANNALMLQDIFDVFDKHIDQMSSYRAFVVPMSDAMKWYNYRYSDDSGSGSVKREIERAFGKQAKGYFIGLVQALNGTGSREYKVGLADKLLKNAKVAAVGLNLRVVAQQPTAYLRAAAMMNMKYLAGGLVGKVDVETVMKYCPIARWKSWGYYETDIGMPMKALLTGITTWKDNVGDKATWLAGKADDVTWKRLWHACELETNDLHPELARGSEEYLRHVGARMSEIIDRTQVVDSVLHRSQLMRSKNVWAKLYTTFMSEPTKSYNLLYSALMSKDGKRIARSAAAFVMSNVAAAAAAAVLDGLRDDDEDKEYWEKYLESFGAGALSQVNPLNMIPGAKDLMSMAQGYSVNRMDMQGIEKLLNSLKGWEKVLNGESSYRWEKYAYDSAKALSSVAGIPIGNLLRDMLSIYQTAFGAVDWRTDTASFSHAGDVLYSAVKRGDKQKEKDLREKMAKMGKSGKSKAEIDGALAAALAVQDERIAEAWTAKEKGQAVKVRQLRSEIVRDGFDQEVVDKAINQWGALQANADEEEKDLDKELNVKLYTYTDLASAIGTASKADVREMEKEIISDSENKKELTRSSLTTAVKERYLSLSGNERGAYAMVLVSMYGYDMKTISGWK